MNYKIDLSEYPEDVRGWVAGQILSLSGYTFNRGAIYRIVNEPMLGKLSEEFDYEDDMPVNYVQDVAADPNDVELLLEFGENLMEYEKFEEALEQLKIGYELVSGDDKDFWEGELIPNILECLAKLNRELSDFPWREQPLIIYRNEVISKMCVYLATHGGRADMDDTIYHAIGDKYLDPADSCFDIITTSDKFRISENDEDYLMLELK